jgi:membrane protease YdiL (CAAX protease family)
MEFKLAAFNSKVPSRFYDYCPSLCPAQSPYHSLNLLEFTRNANNSRNVRSVVKQDNNPTTLIPNQQCESEPLRPLASSLHTLGLLLFLGAWAYSGYRQAHTLRSTTAAPNHFLLYLRTMVFEWIMFIYVALGVRRRGISLKQLLGPRWSVGKANLIDLGFAAAFLVVSVPLLGIVSQLLGIKSSLDDVRFLMPAGPFELVLWVLLSFTAGICEEALFRAYLQRQFAAWTRSLPVGVVLSAILFGAGHIYQGVKHTIVIGLLGLFLGIMAAVRRSTKPGMIAHSVQDSFAGILYRIH